MMQTRREIIKNILDSEGSVQLKELRRLFPDVSEMTLRRDLGYFEEHEGAIRILGGIMKISRGDRVSEAVYRERETVNIEAKEKIAYLAQRFIKSDSVLFIDAGSTAMTFARHLESRNMTVLTTGPNIAEECASKGMKVILTGGVLNNDNLALSGEFAIKLVRSINIDTAVMATSGYSKQQGFTCGNSDENRLKNVVVGKAQKVIMLMDSTKFSTVMPYTFTQMKRVSVLVCETKPPEDVLRLASECGTEVVY